MSKQNSIDKINSNQVISGIYKIENLINHKVYIGQSKDVYKRLRQHIRSSKYNNHGYLYNAIRKYGIENFSFEILIETYDRDYWEKFLIHIYHATDNKYGYNVCLGGIGFSFDEETLEKMKTNSKLAIANRTNEEKREIANKIKTTIDNWSDERRAIYWERRRKADKNRSIFNILCINEKLVECDGYWRKLGHRIKFGALKHIFIYNGLEIRKSKDLYFVKSDNLTKEDIEYFYEHLDDIKIEYQKWWKNTKKTKNELKLFIKCVETNQIKSANEWKKLGYQANNVVHGILKTSKNKHFVLSNIEEYENYIEENPQEKRIDYSNVEKVEREITYAECIETGEIYSVVDWIKLGYTAIRDFLNGKTKHCKNEHFIKVTKSEYIEYMNSHPNKKEKLELDERKSKQLRYAKCVETGEIYSDNKWWKLGYDGIYNVLNGRIKSTKGKHFIKVSEEEFHNFIDNDIKDDIKINHEINNDVYVKCLETEDILSIKEWKILGYNIYNVLKDETKSTRGKHFIKINELEKINYVNEITYVEKMKIIERNKLTKKPKYSKNTIYAKCLETNEILSTKEWKNLGYCKIHEVLNGKREKTRNKHFIKVDKSEYEEFILNNEINYNLHDCNLFIKNIVYAKCIETNEVHSAIEWKTLGFERIYYVLNGTQKRCGGKHFIKSTKEEYESYLKQLSSESA